MSEDAPGLWPRFGRAETAVVAAALPALALAAVVVADAGAEGTGGPAAERGDDCGGALDCDSLDGALTLIVIVIDGGTLPSVDVDVDEDRVVVKLLLPLAAAPGACSTSNGFRISLYVEYSRPSSDSTTA